MSITKRRFFRHLLHFPPFLMPFFPFYRQWQQYCGMGENNKLRNIMSENEILQEPTAGNEEVINNEAGQNTENESTAETTPELSDKERLEAELSEQKDKYIRLLAEFDNYRRRTAKESIELRATASKELMVSLLDVLDDCDRAEKQLGTNVDIELQKEGILLVFNKIRNTLASKGLKAMESIHTEFDVEKHEAITEVPAPSKNLKDKVMDEVQKGYYLNDKIIRFAKVVVGK